MKAGGCAVHHPEPGMATLPPSQAGAFPPSTASNPPTPAPPQPSALAMPPGVGCPVTQDWMQKRAMKMASTQEKLEAAANKEALGKQIVLVFCEKVC
jgi:hypothetical protein